MTRLLNDATLPQKLTQITQPVELCDAEARVIGHFFPKLNADEYDLEPTISNEELMRRKNSKGKSYTTGEVLAHLEKL